MSSSDLSSQQQLSSILKGDLAGIKKPNPTIIVGPRVRNVIWRNLVKKYLNEKMSHEDIVQKILDYDEYVEKGLVTEEKINLAKGKNK